MVGVSPVNLLENLPVNFPDQKQVQRPFYVLPPAQACRKDSRSFRLKDSIASKPTAPQSCLSQPGYQVKDAIQPGPC
jgi:hypothetical protein